MRPVFRRNRMVVRQWQLIGLLADRWLSIAELAAELGVTTRTIRRDIEALEEAAVFPIVNDEDEGPRSVGAGLRWHLLNWRKEGAA